MLADKTLLGGTLAVTFLSGSFAGFATSEMSDPQPVNPYSAVQVYRPELGKLRKAGYTEPELLEAQGLYQDHLDAYGEWWGTFLDTYSDNLQLIDNKLADRLELLDGRVQERVQERKGK